MLAYCTYECHGLLLYESHATQKVSHILRIFPFAFWQAPCSLQYRKTAKDLIDWICDYYARVEGLPVRSEVEPGYLPPLLPTEAPNAPESADAVLSDIRSKIMPGPPHL